VSGLREVLAERTRLLCEIKSPMGEESEIARHVAEAGAKAWFGEVDRIGNSVVFGPEGQVIGHAPSFAGGVTRVLCCRFPHFARSHGAVSGLRLTSRRGHS